MRGGYSSLQAGGGTALPPFNAPARKCQCRAIRSAGKWPRQAAPCEAVSEPENTDLVQVRRAYKFRAFPTRPDPGGQGRHSFTAQQQTLDAGWAQFTSILTGKAAEAGRRLVLVNPASRAGLGSGQAPTAA